MPEIIACPSCGRRLRLREEFLAKRVQCPACQTQFLPAELLPTAPPPAAPPPEPEPEPEPEPHADAGPPEPEPEEAPPRHDDEVPRRPRLRRPRRRVPDVKQRGNTAAGVTVLLGVFALIGLFFAFIVWQAQAPAWNGGGQRPPVAEDPARRQREIAQAFQNPQPLDEMVVAAEVQGLFRGMRDAFAARDSNRLVNFFDVDRIFDEMVAQDLVPPALRRQRDGFVIGFRTGAGQALARNEAFLNWNEVEVKNVRKLAGDEAVVIARHRIADGGSLKIRWWVTKRDGTWRVFDFEDLDMGVRVCSILGAIAAMGPNHPDLPRINHVSQAIQAAVRQDADGAERHLAQVAQARFPPQLDSVRHLASSLVHLQRGQFEEALKAVSRAEALNPNMPGADLLRGVSYNRLGQWDKALAHLDKYRALLGDDAAVNRELGESYRGLNRFAEARVAYRKSLDEGPKDQDAFLGLVRTIGPDDDAADVGPRFRKLGPTREYFEECAEDCRQAHDGPMLGQLAAVMRELDPDYAPADFYLALSRSWAGRPDEAVPLFRAALARQKDAGKRTEYLTEFARALANTGKVLDAYAALGKPREAFRLLAPELRKTFRHDDLKRLVDAHAQKDAADPLLPYYRAEVHVRQGRYALADKVFDEEAKPAEGVNPDDFRASRVLARYHTGRALDAYADIGPRHETFTQLTSLCFTDANYPLLESLLDAHEKEFPGNAEVLRLRSRLAIKRDRFAEGVKWFRAALAKQTQPEGRKQALENFLLDAVDAGKALDGYRAAPDPAEAFAVLAYDLLDGGRRAELKVLLAAHREKHPGDAWTAFYEGECHLDEGAWERAAENLGAAWKQGPDNLKRRVKGRYAFALYKAGRGVAAYREAGADRETFAQVARLMAQDRKGAELEELVAARRPDAGDDPDVPYFAARANVFLGRPAEAVPLLEEACRKQQHVPQRRFYVTDFVHDMEAAGRGLEAYRLAPDRAAAFETLGHTLTHKKQADRLEALLNEHRPGHAADPWLAYFAGELRLLRGDPRGAAEQFAAALAKAPPKQDWTFRRGLLRARVQAGEAVRAYRDSGRGRNPFIDVAQECLAQKNLGQLEALLAEHRRAEPESRILVDWELEVLWLKGDYAGALAHIEKHREDVFAQPSHRWKAENYRVRALVKLKRPDEAVREAEAVLKSRPGDRLLLVLAHAARGDVQQAVAALGQVTPRSYLIGSCYRDPDLGPILRGEAFRAFRERFPEPKGNERFDDDGEPD